MKKEEILKKAIEKAVENGWDFIKYCGMQLSDTSIKRMVSLFIKGTGEGLLFDHSFIKALFSDKRVCFHCGEDLTPDPGDVEEGIDDIGYYYECRCTDFLNDWALLDTLSWQYHIQQLSLAEDRLEYIGRFLK